MRSNSISFEKENTSLKRECLFFAAIFIIALVPRILDLGTTIVADEQLWILRSKQFAKAFLSFDFSGTAITHHPGVITMWLGAISIGIANYLFGIKETANLLFAAQLPFAIATSASVALFFLFSKKAFNRHIAIFSTLLFGFDVFFIAYSRIIHLDAMLSCFMALSFLAILIFYSDSDKKWLIISSVFGGLSVLAKVPGVFMFPMVALVSLTYFAIDIKNSRDQINLKLKRHLTHYAIWAGVAILTIFIVWPAMWTNPMKLAELLLTGPGMAAHEHGVFVLGRPANDPGSLFYLLVIIFRTTPVSLVFLVIGALVLISPTKFRIEHGAMLGTKILLCLAYIFFFYIMMCIPGKKIGRYILPVFPIIALIAGAGISFSIYKISSLLPTKKIKNTLYGTFFIAIAIYQIYNIAGVFPYFLAYYNPAVGGAHAATKEILVGRGEGMDLVADYLNQKAEAESLTVASEFEYLLRVYFKGKVMTTKVELYEPDTLKKCDYLVIYISGLQRRELRIAKEIVAYYESHQPEKIISINNINYAYIYNLKSVSGNLN
jgi:4-amino-4-deoxy-L-arabinose transferase-like glycosyltransferase